MVIYQFLFEAMGFLQLRLLAHTSACYLVFKAFKRVLDSLKHLRTDRRTYAEKQAQIKELMTFAFTDNSHLRLHLRNWVWLHILSQMKGLPRLKQAPIIVNKFIHQTLQLCQTLIKISKFFDKAVDPTLENRFRLIQ